MSVSVYLSNQQIQIAVGNRGKKAGLSNVYTTLAPEGSIINGIVMNPTNFGEFLKEYWTKNNIPLKDIYLVINSNKIAGKQIELPKMNKEKSLDFIQREFADMGRDEDSEQVFAYTKLSENAKEKMAKVYGESAPVDLLRDYVKIFEFMGAELKGIFSSEGSIIGFTRETAAKQAKSFILQLSNDNLLANVVFVDGEFFYYNSVRCFNTPGTDEHLEECIKSLSQLSQFLQTRGLKGQFEKLFVAGWESSKVTFYQELVNGQGINTPVEVLRPGVGKGDVQDIEAAGYLFPVSGLYDFGKEANLLVSMNTVKRDEKEADKLKQKIVIGSFVTAAMVIAIAASWTVRLLKKSKLDELKEYNENVAMDVARYDVLLERSEAIETKYKAMDDITKKIDSYPIATEEIVQIIKDTAEGYAIIEIGNFDAEAGVINVTAKAADVDLINQYIKVLNKMDIFSSVNYTGYSYSGDDAGGIWDIHVACTLAESAGRNIVKATETDAAGEEPFADDSDTEE